VSVFHSNENIDRDYRRCLKIARGHYENFPVASLLVPARLRHHVAAVYAFARAADDVADEGKRAPEERLRELRAIRSDLDRAMAGEPAPRMAAVVDTAHTFGIPTSLFHDLLDAFSQDVHVKRYETFSDLLEYCRKSANPVGRILLLIFGVDNEDARKASDDLCTGLQLANFLQDISVDAEKGRVYLPDEDLRKFHCALDGSRVTGDPADVRRLLQFEIDRTKEFFQRATPLFSALPFRLRLEIRATWHGGMRILKASEELRERLLAERPRLGWKDGAAVFSRALLPVNTRDGESAKRITRTSRTNFYYSFRFLSSQKRDAIHTVYAFCRRTDDIVDEGDDPSVKHARLKRWLEELTRATRGDSEFALLNRLMVIARRFRIPVEHFFELIRGMEMDLRNSRYDTFDELKEYCYKVASTVGLMCSEIFGYRKESARQYAIDLGIALQLTNIVRDVKHDAEQGRIYIPREDFAAFGYSEEELLRCEYNESFRRLMQFECNRARDYYLRARRSLALEDRASFLAARIMDRIYFHILERIEKKNYDVFTEKITISTPKKIWLALSEWFSPAPRVEVADA